MNTLCLLIAAALAQPFAPPAGPHAPVQGAQAPVQMSEILQVVAVHARQSAAPASDPTLKPYMAALKKLPYNTFDLIYQHEQSVQYGAPAQFPINDEYALYTALQSQATEGQVGVDVRVVQDRGQQALDAIRATGSVPRGKPVILRGMELPEGELIVLLTVKQPNQQQQQQQQQNQQQQQQDDQQQQDPQQQQNEEEQKQKEQEEQENQQQMAQNQPEDQESDAQQQEQTEPSQEQLQNIEAILESLREIDRKEQENQAQSRRQRVIVSGDWW